MRLLRSAVLYTALALGANGLAAQTIPDALLSGDMRKIAVHTTPLDVPTVTFLRDDGATKSLADYKGKLILLNFWATWCAPCRKEMPMLSALQTEFGGDDFEVLTIATGRDNAMKIDRFMDGINVKNLPRHQDIGQPLARAMGILGLPVVILINPEGQEIARLIGPAQWDAPEARALIAGLIAANKEAKTSN